MADPVCPSGWTCEFIPPELPEPPSLPWYETAAAPILIVIGIMALGILLYMLGSAVYESLKHRREVKNEELQRQHDARMEEQRTMQIDAAKGNTEILKMIRQAAR